MSEIERKKITLFKKSVAAFRKTHGLRDLPWRTTKDPYKVAVSELMLQQTQVPRVIEKYKTFLKAFPNAAALAAAPLSSVLALWSGLGYNRRAKFLHAAAKEVVHVYKGKFPKELAALQTLPGIGPYTAQAIFSFAYNQPSYLIETNIRTVFIHHFFNDRDKVSDAELLPYIKASIDNGNPREWYWTLMDYGSHLKATGNRVHRKSSQYAKQSAFKGSRREIRGMLMKLLIQQPHSLASLIQTTKKKMPELEAVLSDLIQEGFIIQKGKKYYIV
jgi:A/G-specific adenine glycosylase